MFGVPHERGFDIKIKVRNAAHEYDCLSLGLRCSLDACGLRFERLKPHVIQIEAADAAVDVGVNLDGCGARLRDEAFRETDESLRRAWNRHADLRDLATRQRRFDEVSVGIVLQHVKTRTELLRF